MTLMCNGSHYVQSFFKILYVFISVLLVSLSLSVFDMSFCVYFCMFPVCPLCCFILISMDLESEINDDDDDDSTGVVVLGVLSAAYQVGPVVFSFLGHDAKKMSSSI